MAVGGVTVDSPVGCTLTLGTSSYAAEALRVNWTGLEKGTFETTHMGTTASPATFGGRTHKQRDLADPGELTVDVHYNPDLTPPIETAEEDITITWPKYGDDASAAEWKGSGFCTQFDLTDPIEDLMAATLTFKLTGAVDIKYSVGA